MKSSIALQTKSSRIVCLNLILKTSYLFWNVSEAVVWVIWRCSVKKVFLKISQNSQEYTCGRVSLNLLKQRLWHRCFLVNFVIFLRNTLSYRTPPVAASNVLAFVIWYEEFADSFRLYWCQMNIRYFKFDVSFQAMAVNKNFSSWTNLQEELFVILVNVCT